ncbi:hypothetical protein QOZ80_1AG0014690 [Eleusine coracana subsp. coracana]|nr:hypothetical protein QOZ80_1AG0014690 [Eleusine coracana subsp. coracana]
MAAPSSDGRSRSWANDLPVEMIDTVVKHMDVFSATRLAAVCKSWERAVKTDPTLPFGRPCLLITRELDDNGCYDQYAEDSFELMDLTCYTPWDIPPRALIWGAEDQQLWIGGKDDWLATVDDCGNARLVNPYTGHQIDLPDISTVVPGAAKTRDTFERIILCQTPHDAAGTGYLVIAVVSSLLAIARGGDETWTALRNPDGYRSWFGCYSDAVVQKGKVFAVDHSGTVYAWEIRAGTASPDAEPELTDRPNVNDLLDKFECSWRLAESADGRRLLLVCIYAKEIVCRKTNGYCRDRARFTYSAYQVEGVRLYERDVDAATGLSGGVDDGWSAVASLGDNSLFLGPNYPFLAPIDERDSSGYHQLRPNCVCVTHNQLLWRETSECDLYMFDLGAEGNRYESSKLYSNRFDTYQTPMWHACRRSRLECAVYLAEFDDRDKLRVVLAFCHVSHSDCIDPWLAVTLIMCPLCRATAASESYDPPAVLEVEEDDDKYCLVIDEGRDAGGWGSRILQSTAAAGGMWRMGSISFRLEAALFLLLCKSKAD